VDKGAVDIRRDYVLVLVVEHNPERVELFRKWLENPRVRLLHLKSGDGALNCLKDRFDCILLDHDLLENHPLGAKAKVDGRNEMSQRVKANGFIVEIKPFGEWTEWWAADLKEELLEEFEAGRE
jgi:hypothetical protein